MNLYLRYFDNEVLVSTVDEAIDFLSSIPEIKMTPDLENDIREYVAADAYYPKRYKVRPRVYFIIIKTEAACMADFKARCEKAGVPLPKNVQLASMKPRRYKKVLTVGVYDLLHKGHVELYRRAKGLGDYLIVAAQDSNYILKYKPTAKVLNSTEDRMYMIKSIRYVDEVISYTDVDKIVKEVDFDVFVTGPDQCHEGFQRAIKWCEEHGKEHIVLGRTDGVSSSELKKKIAEKTLSNAQPTA